MNRKEVLVISVAIFLTIIAWVIIDVVQIQKSITVDRQSASPIPDYKIKSSVFTILKEKQP